jgi:hypothetical protein
VTIDSASVYSGLLVTLCSCVALSIRARRVLSQQHSLQCVPWWLPATLGAISTLVAYNLFPLVLDRYTHIVDIAVTIGILFSVGLGLILTKGSNVLLARAYRSASDLRKNRT